VIENGFYYDFFRNEPFTPEDFAAIEKKMRRDFSSRATNRSQGGVGPPRRQNRCSATRAKPFKSNWSTPHSGDERSRSITKATVRSVRAPAYDLDRQDRNGLPLMKVAGSLLARRQQQSMHDAIYGTRLRSRKSSTLT